MKKIINYLILAVALLSLSGCSGAIKNMQIATVDNTLTKPIEGKSKVIFMRPSTLAFGIQSSLFKIKDKKPSIIAIIAAKKKVSYDVEPGKHIFMIMGESADFMYANLLPNKTYYALVTPRMGIWKARFSLKPLTNMELNSEEFKQWIQDCQTVESNTDTKIWANENIEDIQENYIECYKDWMGKDASKRPLLVDYINN